MAAVRAKKPTNRRQRGLWQQHIEDRFELFDKANEWVWEEIVRQAEEAKLKRKRRCSMKGIYENIREQLGQGRKLKGGFKSLNNNWTSRYSLKLKQLRPDLADIFERRTLTAA